MTLPTVCDLCGGGVLSWDEDDFGRCRNCGADIQPYEALSPSERRRIMRIIEIDTASVVQVSGDVL